MTVWIRYLAPDSLAPVDARFNERRDPDEMAAFLTKIATRLGLPPDDEPRAIVDARIRSLSKQYAERYR